MQRPARPCRRPPRRPAARRRAGRAARRDELALDLQADDEEEDAISASLTQCCRRLVEVERTDLDSVRCARTRRTTTPTACWPRPARRPRRHQQDRAGGLDGEDSRTGRRPAGQRLVAGHVDRPGAPEVVRKRGRREAWSSRGVVLPGVGRTASPRRSAAGRPDFPAHRRGLYQRRPSTPVVGSAPAQPAGVHRRTAPMATEPVKDTDPTHRPPGHRRQPRHLHADLQGDPARQVRAKVSVKAGGTGIGLFAAAGFLAVLAIIMLSVAFAYLIHWNGDGLALQWAFLIVFGVYLLIAALLGFIGVSKVKQVARPSRRSRRASRSRSALKGQAGPTPGRASTLSRRSRRWTTSAVAGRRRRPRRSRHLLGGQRVAGVVVGDRRREDHAEHVAGRGDDRAAGVAGPDQPAQREHLADDGAVAVDVGRAQPLLGADPGRLRRRTGRPAGSRAPRPASRGLAVAGRSARSGRAPVVDGEHGDVDVGVVVDDRRRHRGVADHAPRARRRRRRRGRWSSPGRGRRGSRCPRRRGRSRCCRGP